MPKLNINGIKASYDAIDCTDKLVIMKIPYDIINDKKNHKSLMELCKYIKNERNAKDVLVLSDNISFETMDTDEAIYRINFYIHELRKIKAKLKEEGI